MTNYATECSGATAASAAAEEEAHQEAVEDLLQDDPREELPDREVGHPPQEDLLPEESGQVRQPSQWSEGVTFALLRRSTVLRSARLCL